MGCCATRRRQCSVSPHRCDSSSSLLLIHSAPALHPSLSLLLSATFTRLSSPFQFHKLHCPEYFQNTLTFPLQFNRSFVSFLKFESLRLTSSLSSPSFHAFSPSRWRKERSVGVCQRRRGTLKAHLSPWTSTPPDAPNLLSPLCHCDLWPFTLAPKQTGHDPPPESRSHRSLGTRREEKDADGNFQKLQFQWVVFSAAGELRSRLRTRVHWIKVITSPPAGRSRRRIAHNYDADLLTLLWAANIVWMNTKKHILPF